MKEKEIENLNKLLYRFTELVDEFDYKKNGVESTKDFIKYLLYELYKQATESTD